ncbi:unnamed protein product [Sphagnum balticum]
MSLSESASVTAWSSVSLWAPFSKIQRLRRLRAIVAVYNGNSGATFGWRHCFLHGGGRFCQDPDFLPLLDISNLFKPAQRVQTNLVHSSHRKYCLHSLCWRYFLYGWSSFRFGRAVARRTIFPFAL